MNARLSKILLTASAVAVLAAPAAQAKHGADDPAGHVRHARHAQIVAAKKHHHKRHARHHLRRADDRGVRRGGADDGPNHR